MSVPWGGGGEYTPLAGQKWLPGAVIPDLPTVIFKHRQAGIWVSRSAVPKIYLAGSWVFRRPKRWTGTDWVDLP